MIFLKSLGNNSLLWNLLHLILIYPLQLSFNWGKYCISFQPFTISLCESFYLKWISHSPSPAFSSCCLTLRGDLQPSGAVSLRAPTWPSPGDPQVSNLLWQSTHDHSLLTVQLAFSSFCLWCVMSPDALPGTKGSISLFSPVKVSLLSGFFSSFGRVSLYSQPSNVFSKTVALELIQLISLLDVLQLSTS